MPELHKRIVYYDNGSSNNDAWYTYRWILFAIFIPVLIVSFLIAMFYRRRQARVTQTTTYAQPPPPPQDFNSYGYNYGQPGMAPGPPPGPPDQPMYAPPPGPPPLSYQGGYNPHTVTDENTGHTSTYPTNEKQSDPNAPPPVYPRS